MAIFYDVIGADGTPAEPIVVNNADELPGVVARLHPTMTYTVGGVGNRLVTLVRPVVPPQPALPITAAGQRLADAYARAQLIQTTVPIWQQIIPAPGGRTEVVPPVVTTTNGWTVVEQAQVAINDTEVPANRTPIHVTINGQYWRVYWRGGTVAGRANRTIYVQAAPVRNWRPGQPIPPRSIASWRRRGELIFDQAHGLLINRNTSTVFVFGLWKPKYLDIIVQHMRVAEVPHETKEDDLATFDKIMLEEKDRAYLDSKRQLEAVTEDVNHHLNLLTGQMRRKAALEEMLANYKTKVDDGKKASMILEKVRKLEGVEVAGIVRDEIHVFTKHIYVPLDGKTYDIGKFKIAINGRSGRINMTNLTRTIHGMQHPHVRYPEAACYGSIANSIPELTTKMMFPELVTMLIRYLRSVDPKDAIGKTIYEWPLAPVGNEPLKAAGPAPVPPPLEEPEAPDDDDEEVCDGCRQPLVECTC